MCTQKRTIIPETIVTKRLDLPANVERFSPITGYCSSSVFSSSSGLKYTTVTVLQSSKNPFRAYSPAKEANPLSVTGVSHKFKTCNLCKCSEIVCSPTSPNWVDHRFRYRKEGNLIKYSAQAEVTLVKARLSHSKFPNDPLLSSTAKSASVDLDGRVNFRGPPFCC